MCWCLNIMLVCKNSTFVQKQSSIKSFGGTVWEISSLTTCKQVFLCPQVIFCLWNVCIWKEWGTNMAIWLKTTENVAQNPIFEDICLKTRNFIIHLMVMFIHKTIFLVSLLLCKALLVLLPKIYGPKYEHLLNITKINLIY